jgi:hypothetical protein
LIVNQMTATKPVSPASLNIEVPEAARVTASDSFLMAGTASTTIRAH